ncbi:hypothetical protein E2986_05046 [Frieseomelitta varia]|uniref:Uncharacterized protein n=1 Tax=Frieseomelitta varia TaxID=561572 RepID=A0A833SM24_9HYME|nr:hypothetical protein E2986_05046 [Frieseomelitta varia]
MTSHFLAQSNDKLIKPIMITAKIISIWPLAEDNSKGTIMFRRFHVFCIFVLVIVMSVAVTANVVHNIDNLDEATECTLICTAFHLCVVRLLVHTSHQKDMLYVVNTMRKDWVLSSREDREIWAERTMFAFRLYRGCDDRAVHVRPDFGGRRRSRETFESESGHGFIHTFDQELARTVANTEIIDNNIPREQRCISVADLRAW